MLRLGWGFDNRTIFGISVNTQTSIFFQVWLYFFPNTLETMYPWLSVLYSKRTKGYSLITSFKVAFLWVEILSYTNSVFNTLGKKVKFTPFVWILKIVFALLNSFWFGPTEIFNDSFPFLAKLHIFFVPALQKLKKKNINQYLLVYQHTCVSFPIDWPFVPFFCWPIGVDCQWLSGLVINDFDIIFLTRLIIH